MAGLSEIKRIAFMQGKPLDYYIRLEEALTEAKQALTTIVKTQCEEDPLIYVRKINFEAHKALAKIRELKG